jgi:hypothetical protein
MNRAFMVLVNAGGGNLFRMDRHTFLSELSAMGGEKPHSLYLMQDVTKRDYCSETGKKIR